MAACSVAHIGARPFNGVFLRATHRAKLSKFHLEQETSRFVPRFSKDLIPLPSLPKGVNITRIIVSRVIERRRFVRTIA